MKKKLLCGLLVASMSMSFLACGETTESTTEESVATEIASTEEAVTEATAETVVKTTSYGEVEGLSYDTYQVWYGIPYAAAPTGDLRWAAPEDPEAWTETLDCTEAGNKAIQAGTDYTTGENVISGEEDCLNLDIYSTEGAENLPVMVYIHGGNNQTGDSSEIKGTEIVVDENCVFVSLNYRLGILGFNCLPAFQTEEDATGNYAMLDIAKALDWIQENIAEFGGDPDNITVSGFSAGGRDVMAMLISPIFEGKFDKAVVFSGGMTVAEEDASATKIAEAVAPLAVEDGMAEDEDAAVEWLLSEDESVVTYMKGIDAERLCTLMANAGIRMSVFPHLYADDVVIPEEGFATTEYNSVPVLMLTGSTEFSFFAAFDGYFSSDAMADLSEDEIAAAKEFAINYGSDMYRIFNAQCSAETMYENYDSNIYICQIEYGSKDSATQIPVIGSFHGIFVPTLMTENNYVSYGDFSSEGYMVLATTFDSYLKNFLATGDPNGEGLTEWTNWTPDAPVSMVLDADDAEVTAELKDVSKTYEEIMDEMDADTSVSEEVKEMMIQNVMNGRWFSDALDTRYGNASLWD